MKRKNQYEDSALFMVMGLVGVLIVALCITFLN
jgi:hypothetical protein